MDWIRFIRRVYSPETLDYRFVVPANAPPAQLLADRDEANFKPTPLPNARPSLWKTPEFFLYYILLCVVIPLMIKTPVDVSQRNLLSFGCTVKLYLILTLPVLASNPDYSRYSHLLSDGWILGRKADNSDDQYASFRDNIPALLFLLILHPLVRKIYDIFSGAHLYINKPPLKPNRGSNNTLTQGLPASAIADARLNQRLSFDFYFAFLFIIALHGFSAAKIFAILYINFRIAKSSLRQHIPAATWLFNIGILFANDFASGYPYHAISSRLTPGEFSGWGAWLDKHGGLISRWEVLFNICILRLVSFNMDYYWSQNSIDKWKASIEKKQLDPADPSVRDRVNISVSLEDFSFRNYVAYILYAPLYLTGPIITFNDFISQQRYRPSSITTKRTLMYAARFLVVLLTMELVIHFIYAVAISKGDPDWSAYTSFQLSMLGYFNLHHIWLKLLIPWRFFRLWSLIDGVDPPENMARCMSDNYSALAFWRGWHCSFNRWIVRYVYIPLGGSGQPGFWGSARSVANFALVFMFVAVWHDINLRLLMWGWLVTLFILPEIIAPMLFPAKRWQRWPNTYRIICGIGAIGNILMMMTANLVGYAIGIEGLKGLVAGIIGSTTGAAMLAMACGSLYMGAQMMFEVREQEKREGIRMRC